MATSTAPFTTLCRTADGTSELENPMACGGGLTITSPGGSVFCHGGTASLGACHNVIVSNDIGCVICGSENACKTVKIGDIDISTLSTTYPYRGFYVHNQCTFTQVADYVSKVDPNGSVTQCEDKNDNEVCDVVEYYCTQNPVDDNCVDVPCDDINNDGFCDALQNYCSNNPQDAKCTGVPLITCEADVPEGACVLDGNDVTCNTFGHYDRIIQGCDTVECAQPQACWKVADSTNIKCSGDYACGQALLDGFDTLECSNRVACEGTKASGVQTGGLIDVVSNPEQPNLPVFGRYGAMATSTAPFTTLCRTADGTSELENPMACGGGLTITSPGGSVFCHGGTASLGACHNVIVSNDIGCVICGSKNACKSVSIGSEQIRTGLAYVSKKCTGGHVIDYLLKLHSSDGGIPCEDNNNNGFCDTVDEFCKGKGSNCVRRFRTGWLVSGQQAAATLSESDSNKDSDNLDSGIVGAIVIGSIFFIMMIAVLYMGHKNQWSWWKEGRDRKQDGRKDTSVTEPTFQSKKEEEKDCSSKVEEEEHIEKV